jgi:hypothetical protein
MDWTAIFTAIKPIAAQGARDGLRLIGMGLATHGFVQNGAGVEAFVGAGMTLAGLFWGWFTTSGYLQVAGLLKKITAQRTQANAVEAAKALPPAAAVQTSLNQATVRAVTNILLVAFVLSAFLAGSPAFAQVKLVKPTGDIVKDIQSATGQPQTPLGRALTGSAITDIQGFLNAKFLPDLQYALKLAQASKNNITADCYQAWIDIITTQQNAIKGQDGTDMAMPDPHVITDFEKLVELRNALQPESPFMVKCSPIASMVKKDIAGFMGIVISGGAGLATLVPGL